jgi:Bacterial sugar transferase
MPVLHEWTELEARAKYCAEGNTHWLPAPNDVFLMDHLPGLPLLPMCASYAAWFKALQAWLPRVLTPDRLGLREIQPGVWAGLRTRISPSARLLAPCWLGESVTVGPCAVVGPMAILEDKVFIEAAAEVSTSVVGAETLVGECTEVKDSMALGSILINWKTNSSVQIDDPFLLCALNQHKLDTRSAGWFGRLAALGAMAGTWPLVVAAILMSKLNGRPALNLRAAVRPGTQGAPGEIVRYYELTNHWLRRWPQLWNIAGGTFAWVGNRPLSQTETASLTSDFERLWLTAPIGLFSLADAEACPEAFSDEARAHASFYAVQANWRLDLAILKRVLLAPARKKRSLLTDDQSNWRGVEHENKVSGKHIAYQRT